MFCPQAVVWGDVATIISAVATFSAVWVALVTARRAADLERSLRAAERQVELSNEARLRSQLSIAFDQELSMMIGQLDWAEGMLRDAAHSQVMDRALHVLQTSLPDKGLVLMDRFAADFVVFPPEVGARLLHGLGSWIALRDAPPPDFSDTANVWEGVSNVLKTLNGMSASMREARRMPRQFVPDGVDLTPLD